MQEKDAGSYVTAMEHLVAVVQQLSLARNLDAVAAIVRTAARGLTGADGATFVLREGERCYYVEENAVAPLWKGQRFPMGACMSGWTILHRKHAIVEDINADGRISPKVYESTFVKSLLMVPIRTMDPIGAIGNYWAERHVATPNEVKLLQALADATAVALENVQVHGELEQRVKERTAELEAASKDLESFSYSVSHDLRAPIRAISGFCSLIREDHAASLDAEAQRKLGVIKAEADRMSALIEDLLAFSRVGRGALQPVDLDMHSLARTALARLKPDKRVSVDFESLPRASGDRVLIEQVWTNLLSNALKFSSKKDKPLITIGGMDEGSESVYFVRDNGAGFDPRYQSRLFGVFQKLHHDHEFPGSGVGLALVHRIVTRHGGRVWAEARLGENATFFFALPRKAAAAR